MIKIHSPCRDNKILLVSSLNIFISLPYALKYETFVVLPLFCHSIISKQHIQFNGNTVCRDTNNTQSSANTLCNLTVATPKVICHKSGLKMTHLHKLHLV